MAVAAIAAFVLVSTAIVIVVRSDGLPAVDATASRATRWFVHQGTGRVVLVDGFSGRALARLDTGADGAPIGVAEGAAGAYLLNGTTAEARIIDNSALRLGPPTPVAPLTAARPLVGVARNGLTVIDPETSDGVVLSDTGEVVPFSVTLGESGLVASDGAVWTVSGSDLIRSGSTGERFIALGTNDVEMTLLGPAAAVLDATARRVRLSDGGWVDLDGQSAPSEFVLQVPGPTAPCVWVGADDVLWCVSSKGVDERIDIPGLDLDGGDRLAIGGGAAAVIRQNPPSILRLDVRAGTLLPTPSASVPSGSALEPTATADLIWVDDTQGDLVWAVHPWGINAIRKNDDTTPLLGESGEVIAGGSSSSPAGAGLDDGDVAAEDDRTPDDNGIDDPPVAVDDPVTARAGTTVPVSVIANDYDPDGEAIVVVSTHTTGARVGRAGERRSSVVYQPEPGYVGLDQFDYTIVDGDGTEATAKVTRRVAVARCAEPIAGRRERHRRDGAGHGGHRRRAPQRHRSRARRAAHRFVHAARRRWRGDRRRSARRDCRRCGSIRPPGASGTATFTYRPVDSFDAVGEPVVGHGRHRPTHRREPTADRPNPTRVRCAATSAVVVPVLVERPRS